MKINIAVTGLNATDNPGPGLGIIRSIRNHPAFQGKIIGLAYDAKEPAIYLEGVCDEVYLIPFPSGGTESLMRRLAYICSKTKIDFMIPSLDSELKSFIQLEPQLNELGVKMFLPTMESLESREKKYLKEVAAKAKIGNPKTIEITSYENVEEIAKKIGFPLVVKGVFYEAELVNNTNEMLKSIQNIASRWGFPILLQEFIKGEEFDISLVGDGKGKVLGLTSMRKMQLTTKGKAWGGMTLDSSEILNVVKRIVKALDWRGPMEVELMRRQKDGKYFIIEINPRFPAWIYLSQGAGCNLPGVLLDFLYGEVPDKVLMSKPGVIFLRASQDFIVSMDDYEKMIVTGELNRNV